MRFHIRGYENPRLRDFWNHLGSRQRFLSFFSPLIYNVPSSTAHYNWLTLCYNIVPCTNELTNARTRAVIIEVCRTEEVEAGISSSKMDTSITSTLFLTFLVISCR